MDVNMQTVEVKINGQSYNMNEDMTILEACESVGIKIPTLCYLKGICEEGSCGICVVEVKKFKALRRACITKIMADMEIFTNTPSVREARRTNLELLLANHPKDCLVCSKSASCDLRKLTEDFGLKESRFEKTRAKDFEIDISSPSIVRDPNKCILCRRCVEVCSKVQKVNAICIANRGSNSTVSTSFEKGLGNVECTNCGQCVLVCPTGALTEKEYIEDVWKELAEPEKFVIVQTAPAVRASIGEEFGLPAGTLVTGRMVAALRRVGFKKVFDTQFSADLTIMEEGSELLHRLNSKGVFPMITSCSPGWIKFIEHFYPDLIGHLSSCKSPQQMFGAVAKTYYAEKLGIDPRKMVVVSIMPCTAKKFEARRPEFDSAFNYWQEKGTIKDITAFSDIDYVLTTREAAKMIKEGGIDFIHLKDEDFDAPLGMSSGAGVIFANTGGVMEAAIRTAYELVTGKSLEKLECKSIRGLDGIKTADIDIAGTTIKVAVAHGLSNARILLDEIKEGKSPYHFIEIMACPGGCIGGGGQPYNASEYSGTELRKKRASAIYKEDEGKKVRKSHENEEIKALYKEFLGKPLGEKSHKLLHTKYTKRGI
ncbi:MAG: NADP-reducing hydrogenase subunit HndC [Elusimicrobia bacterium ADurb.Bin231]|nr:MAG: NADP-reducing hydrogenase subunit HndC [Elusimicrobia bacterium ADurb.Bin231]